MTDKGSCLWETVCIQIRLNHKNEQMFFHLLSAWNVVQCYPLIPYQESLNYSQRKLSEAGHSSRPVLILQNICSRWSLRCLTNQYGHLVWTSHVAFISAVRLANTMRWLTGSVVLSRLNQSCILVVLKLHFFDY